MTVHEIFVVVAWVGGAAVAALFVFLLAWHLRDKYVFGESDRAELNRLLGAYDESDDRVPVEGAATHRKSRSPFARPRKPTSVPKSVID